MSFVSRVLMIFQACGAKLPVELIAASTPISKVEVSNRVHGGASPVPSASGPPDRRHARELHADHSWAASRGFISGNLRGDGNDYVQQPRSAPRSSRPSRIIYNSAATIISSLDLK